MVDKTHVGGKTNQYSCSWFEPEYPNQPPPDKAHGSCTWLLRHSDTRKTATQHKAFSNSILRWGSNPNLVYSRCGAPPAELLRQLSWPSSKSPVYKPQLSKAKWVHLNMINRWTRSKCTCVHCSSILTNCLTIANTGSNWLGVPWAIHVYSNLK